MKKPCYLNVTRKKIEICENNKLYICRTNLVKHGFNWKEYLKENSWHK